MNLTVAALVAALLTGGGAPAPQLTPHGKEVACTSASKRVTGRNALNMPLYWYQVNVTWCWDKNLVITRGSNYTTHDTPAMCWQFDGDRAYHQEGGRGNGSWDVSRQGAFSCSLGPMTDHRTVTVELHMTGGGGVD